MPACLPEGADICTPYHTLNKLLTHLCPAGEGGGVGGWGGVTHRLTDTEVGHSVHMNMTKGLLMGVTHLQLGDWGCLCSASAAA